MLAAVAFARRFAAWFTDETCTNLLATAERVADGEVEMRVLTIQKKDCLARVHAKPAELPGRSADYLACELGFYAARRAREMLGLPWYAGRPPAIHGMLMDMLHWHRQIGSDAEWFDAEEQAFLDICADLGGVPATPFDPGWRTEAVVGLASGMDERRDFGPMPVLADALEDAGCADADVLAHCRGPGPHVRGCWVVDLVLGKA